MLYTLISMYTATLTSQGQITVPVEMREKVGLKPGDRLIFWYENGRFVVVKEEGIESLRGVFAKYAVGKPKLTKKRLEKIRSEMWTERYRRSLK